MDPEPTHPSEEEVSVVGAIEARLAAGTVVRSSAVVPPVDMATFQALSWFAQDVSVNSIKQFGPGAAASAAPAACRRVCPENARSANHYRRRWIVPQRLRLPRPSHSVGCCSTKLARVAHKLTLHRS